MIEQETCRYCGGECPHNHEYMCDGYSGDIDNLYEKKTMKKKGVNKMKTKKELDSEVREAFDRAIDAIMFDYMYMGTEKGRDDLEYMGFKHIETREYIKIPKCGIAFRKKFEKEIY